MEQAVPNDVAGGAARTVRRRLVCYLSGFDPQGPSHYHQLFATESVKQAALAGYQITTGRRRKTGEHMASWDVSSQIDGQRVETRYDFLRWDDIVRQHWPRGRLRLLERTVFASTRMWANGVMWRALKTSWPMALAIILPGVALLVGALLLLVLAAAAGALFFQGHLLAGGLVLIFGGPTLIGALALAETRTQMAWLMRSLACLVLQGRGQLSTLESRLDVFGAHVAEQLIEANFDEVLVVGHSSGAMLAMSVVQRALEAVGPSLSPESPQVSLLTLGHCAPLLSYQPEAHAFRQELARLAAQNRLNWVDFGSPVDGCCFALRDPTATMGHARHRPDHPKILNPLFVELFSADRYRAIKRDKFRCHFQYLMAGEILGAYDFFRIVAGPLFLFQGMAHARGVVGFRRLEFLGGPDL
jgi:hypothetical protein